VEVEVVQLGPRTRLIKAVRMLPHARPSALLNTNPSGVGAHALARDAAGSVGGAEQGLRGATDE
jgi:hypothetical protein